MSSPARGVHIAARAAQDEAAKIINDCFHNAGVRATFSTDAILPANVVVVTIGRVEVF